MRVVGSEFVQFGVMALGFVVIFALWMAVVYLPGRTMERWEGEARAEEARSEGREPNGRRARNNLSARDPLARS
ncbi:Hypothetical Protein RradSPS_2507 [Rubrobacter radiotolerans]|uniref:Uncharacterized protein n=1 Tax=Rubrobacter radiotolerans TaxID=42256 RepID=A0A023X6Y7_RUBRA|nr:hypothetical protein [Rubrobacter radiotolerans]AHY47790.1 Hypothetical Protein RradSPS_2507 [Rubrobacter radiotolerans]MDX5892429.1 hypothetical protein [Rubrobacter radiotolerans]SMC07720.1 conserved hypothetical protein [Rubrobacter radiotolerans DSM 5868]